MSLDTSFLIDQQREASRRQPGRAHAFLREHANDVFCVPLTAWGEYLAGFSDLNDPFVLGLRARLEILDADEEVARTYSRLFRTLKNAGRLIGANDLWIASTALRHNTALVTANLDEFQRIPDLQAVAY